ncbi:hypothetical protein GCM10009564_03280 [Streptomyces thermogriseus]|uniref:Uncharacterized protein n=1 Tax=Streptomyces thermogriseus TaxID=75292 RepID=A0ABN1SRZ8_9ACTN
MPSGPQAVSPSAATGVRAAPRRTVRRLAEGRPDIESSTGRKTGRSRRYPPARHGPERGWALRYRRTDPAFTSGAEWDNFPPELPKGTDS